MKAKYFLSAALLAALGTQAQAQTQTQTGRQLVAGIQAQAQTQTGRQLDVIAAPTAVTTVPSTGTEIPFFVRPVVGIFWDERCAKVDYTFNSSVPINPFSETPIAPEVVADIVQTGLDRWNENPSSYIEMNITNVTELGVRPRIGGDFINEVTFITPNGFTALASSPSTSLIADATFIAGEDLDLDGDSDVFDPEVEGRNTCGDIDGDGDIEFPAGDYRAGTILDNDVQFGTGVLWETEPTATGGADIDAVSTHEFGHSHGLSHSTVNQISSTDGTTSTMFPFISTSNPAAEFGSRTPHTDDLAASAFIYQEGNGDTEISELQTGDIPFSSAYSVVTGTTSDGAGAPVSAAAVSLTNRRTGVLETMTYSGQTVVFDNGAGGLFAFEEAILNGDYAIPVPANNVYTANIEALDGSPVATGNISTSAIVSGIAGNTSFPEEGYTRRDAAVELRPKEATPFYAGRFGKSDIDFVINEETVQRNAGDITFGGTGAIVGASSIRYAEVFDRDDVLARIANGDIPVAGLAETFLIQEAAATFSFSQGALAIGTLNEDGLVEISSILGSERDVLAQDGDGTRVSFRGSRGLPFRIKSAFNRDPNAQLFFLLDIDNVQAGPNSGLPLGFVGIDTTVSGTSFLSLNNGPLAPFGSTFAMELRYANDGRRVSPFLTR